MHKIVILLVLLGVEVACSPKKGSLACFHPDPETGECLDTKLAADREKQERDKRLEEEKKLNRLKDELDLIRIDVNKMRKRYDAATDDNEKQRLGEQHNELVTQAEAIANQIRYTYSWAEVPKLGLPKLDLPRKSPPQISFSWGEDFQPIFLPTSADNVTEFKVRYARKDVKSPSTDLSDLEIPLVITFAFASKKYCASPVLRVADLPAEKNSIIPEECRD